MAVRTVCVNALWLLKNSFQGILITRFVRKLLNVRSPQTLKFAEITGLVPFFNSHAPISSTIGPKAGCGYWQYAFPDASKYSGQSVARLRDWHI